MAYKNRQQIFEAAYTGLRAQGFLQSIRPEGTSGPNCVYRGPLGRKCAVGHCIPDDKYNPVMDKSSDDVGTGIEARIDIRRAAGIRIRDVEFARQLQVVHDRSCNPIGMKYALRAFAERYKLRIPA